MKITHYKESRFNSIPYFLTKSLFLLQPCSNKQEVCVSLIGTVPCPANVTKFSMCESHHQQSQTLNYIAGLPTGGNLRMLDQGCRVEGVTLSNQILCWLPKYPNLFVALHCHDEARFPLDSCETELV